MEDDWSRMPAYMKGLVIYAFLGSVVALGMLFASGIVSLACRR